MVNSRPIAAGTGLLAVISLGGCASTGGADGADRPAAEAHGPRAAALGYYEATVHPRIGHPITYGCRHSPGPEKSAAVVAIVQSPAATVQRAGARWVVTISGDGQTAARYQVLKNRSGYCVDRELNP